jgi:hypothetical protein
MAEVIINAAFFFSTQNSIARKEEINGINTIPKAL